MDSSQVSVDQQPIQSQTFGRDASFHVNEAVGSASISPSGRDIVLASPAGLHIIDLDDPWTPPRHISHQQTWEVADVQWSPHASRDYWVVSTSNQKALVWNLNIPSTQSPLQFILHGHTRAITDINFSARNPDLLATCSVDSSVLGWDLRSPSRPAMAFADWTAGASQVKWNRQDEHVLASSHDRMLHIWDTRHGAHPIRTIEAHATKIYGIDWNRIIPTKILTCSLDKSIKFWDYSDSHDHPRRVIRTTYPVWRARHTPFGWGVLAMPQRGDYSLHLYDRRLSEGEPRDAIIDPLHSFTGHEGQVKEFLWRVQGIVEDGIDNREYQLVSWSTDRDLRLYRVDDDLLNSVGYCRGQQADKRVNFTRKGANYKTFHDPKSADQPGSLTSHGLASLFRHTGLSMRKASIGVAGLGFGVAPGVPSGMRVRSGERKDTDPIQWMKGVKIGESMPGTSELLAFASSNAPPWATKESLGDEIAHVGSKYRHVKFEEVDVTARLTTISLSGPWSEDGDLTHVRLSLRYPEQYPEFNPPRITIERTSSISDAMLAKLSLEIKTICDAYAEIGRGSLEALICYMLGESDLDECIAWVNGIQRAMNDSVEADDELSSSDEGETGLLDSTILPPSTDLETSETGNLEMVNANVNVPLPKACGAVWTKDGRLICFFPTMTDSTLFLSTSNVGSIAQANSNGPFEAFGYFGLRRAPLSDSEMSDLSDNSSTFSSISSARLSVTYEQSGSRQNPTGYGRPTLSHSRSVDQQPSLRNFLKDRKDFCQQKISIKTCDDLIPSKKFLGEEYIIYGSGSDVCNHNATVARRHGLEDVAVIWELIELILKENIPLTSIAHPYESDLDILVIAQRVVVKKASRHGLKLMGYDYPMAVEEPDFTTRLKLGQGPLGTSWLIARLFDYFEQKADIQMLAMLSCVFAEQPLNDDSANRAVLKIRNDMSPQEKAPAFSLDYFDTIEIGMDFLRPDFARSASNFSPPIEEDGESLITVNPPFWNNATTETDEYSPSHRDKISPPYIARQGSKISQISNTTASNSYSSSPEEAIRRSASMLTQRFTSSFTRPFSFITSSSASPPSSQRTSEFSSSVPIHGPYAPASWGRSSSFNDHSPSFHRDESRSSLQYEIDNESLESSEADGDDEDDWEIVCTRKNIDRFEEGKNVPLLDPAKEATYRAWRASYAHLLFVWGLPLKRAEILKFNNLANIPQQRMSDEKGTCSASPVPSQEPIEATSPSLYCAMCFEQLDALYRTCTTCQHASHRRCMVELQEALMAVSDGVESDEFDAGCEAGCGCACDGEDMMESESIVGDTAEVGRDGELQRLVRKELAKDEEI